MGKPGSFMFECPVECIITCQTLVSLPKHPWLTDKGVLMVF